jgi:hypothetical protein
MYGDGLVARRCRYRSIGSARSGLENRWDSTIWKASPALMYSLARRTFSSNRSRVMVGRQPAMSSAAAGVDTSGRPVNLPVPAEDRSRSFISATIDGCDGLCGQGPQRRQRIALRQDHRPRPVPDVRVARHPAPHRNTLQQEPRLVRTAQVREGGHGADHVGQELLVKRDYVVTAGQLGDDGPAGYGRLLLSASEMSAVVVTWPR